MTDECPPPEMTRLPDGSVRYRVHCWRCAPKVQQLNEPRRPPESRDAKAKRPTPWTRTHLAKFMIDHCQTTGRTYDWIIEHYSNGTITPTATPAEFARRLKCLYAIMPFVREEIMKQSQGQLHLPTEFIGTGLRADNMPNHASWLQVLPVKQVVVL